MVIMPMILIIITFNYDTQPGPVSYEGSSLRTSRHPPLHIHQLGPVIVLRFDSLLHLLAFILSRRLRNSFVILPLLYGVGVRDDARKG